MTNKERIIQANLRNIFLPLIPISTSVNGNANLKDKLTSALNIKAGQIHTRAIIIISSKELAAKNIGTNANTKHKAKFSHEFNTLM